jgi:hypothetical protein
MKKITAAVIAGSPRELASQLSDSFVHGIAGSLAEKKPGDSIEFYAALMVECLHGIGGVLSVSNRNSVEICQAGDALVEMLEGTWKEIFRVILTERHKGKTDVTH